jgi:hypothetical protein
MAKAFNATLLRVECERVKDCIDEVDRDLAVIDQHLRERSDGDDLADHGFATAHKTALEAHLKALTDRMRFLGVDP